MDIEALEKLANLKDKGLITQEEFEEQKKELLHPIQSQSEEQNVKKDSVKILKDLKDKGLKKLKEQNIPEKLKILSEKGVEKLKEQNIPEKLKILSEKGVEKLKEQNIPEKLKILSEKGVEKLKEQNIPEKLNKLKDKGLITQEEFETQKQKLMNNTSQITQNNSYASNQQDISAYSYFLECITTKYCCFKGRASRKEYFSFIMFYVLLSFVIPMLLLLLGGGKLANISSTIITLVFLLPNLGGLIRRLHDINFSGWWIGLPIIELFVVAFINGIVSYASAN